MKLLYGRVLPDSSEGTLKRFTAVALGNPTYEGTDFVIFRFAADIRARAEVFPSVPASIVEKLKDMAVGSVRYVVDGLGSSIVIGKFKPDKVVALHIQATIPSDTEGKCFAVPLSMVFPAFDAQVHSVGMVFSKPGHVQWHVQDGIRDIHNVFVKFPLLFKYANEQTDIAAKHVAHEARICERLKERAHPNIASYFGVLHDGKGLIRGLCFLKYKSNLQERVKNSRIPLNKEAFLDGVRQGMEFLHGLGLVHNDIHPSNIMMGADDVPVLTDFSSTREIGKITKGGSNSDKVRWTTHPQLSCVENDYFAFEKLVKYLNDEVVL